MISVAPWFRKLPSTMAGQAPDLIELLAAAAVTLVACAVIVVHDLSWPMVGHDHKVYCAAIRAIDAGQDPYLVENLAHYEVTNLSYSYPPLAAELFRPTCELGDKAYVLADVLLLLVAFLLVRALAPSRHGVLLVAILVAGFLAFRWNVKTGNIGMLELVLLAGAFRLVWQGRYSLPLLLVGVLGFLKVVPLAFALLALFVDRSAPLKKRLLRLSIPFATAGALLAVSALLYPHLMESYFRQLVGDIPGQHAAIKEDTSATGGPTFWLFAKDISESFFSPDLVSAPVSGVMVGVWALFSSVLLWRIVKKAERADEITLLSLAFLVVTTLLPRLRPYGFVYVLIPVWFLLTNRPLPVRLMALSVMVALPLAASLENNAGAEPLRILISNLQLIALLLISAFLLVDFDRSERRGDARAPDWASHPAMSERPIIQETS